MFDECALPLGLYSCDGGTMTVRPFSITFVVLLSSLHAFAQQTQSPVACPATEQAVREVGHQLWSSYRSRDVSTYEKLVDDGYISTDDGGVRKGKQDVLAELRKLEGSIHTDTDEQPADFRVVFTGGVAIVNSTKHWTDYDKKAGISWGATSRTTRVLTCKNGEWKLVAFHETDIPNKNRQPSTGASDHLDDYVGHYRFGENGDKGELSVIRVGDKLSESWAGGEATELLPGKYDTFFSRDDGWVERFVRDRSGKVTGILYTLVDGELEAKRVP
jgi:ketosteroid isomerase-like protein